MAQSRVPHISFTNHCPRCGTTLETAHFAEHWDPIGNLLGTETDLVCRTCRIRWADFLLDCEEEVSSPIPVTPRQQ